MEKMEKVKTLDTPLRPRELFRQFAWASAHPLAWAAAHPMLCAAAFFLFAFALRLLYAGRLGSITMSVYPDEWRYLHLARSIAEGGPLLIQGLPAEFQKILYPLVISPASLLTRDLVAQVKIIEAINCLAMASMVFPTALLVKKLTPKPAVLLLTLAFVCALPDFMYTVFFLSEPLYYPLCLWVFYFFCAAMERQELRRRWLYFALFGFFTYLAYCTREIGAAFLIAAAAMLVIEGFRKKKWKENAVALGLVLSAFFAPYFVVKRALFPGLGNSYDGKLSGYDQIGLSALRVPGAFSYLLYSAAALFMAAILSFYILPVLIPLFRFRKLGREKRGLYIFVLLSLAITAGAVAYTVYIREPHGEPLPRLHLRMIAPMAVPFVIVCFDALLSKEKLRIQKRGRRSIWVLTAALAVCMVALMPRVPIHDDWFDHASLTATYLSAILTNIGMEAARANWVWLIYLLLMLALMAAGVLCFLRKKRGTVLAILLCAICAVSAMDNYVANRTREIFKNSTSVEAHLAASMEGRAPGDYFPCMMDILFSKLPPRDSASLAQGAVALCDFLLSNPETKGSGIGVCTRPSHVLTYASQHLRVCEIRPAMVEMYAGAGYKEVLAGRNVDPTFIVVLEDYNPFTNFEVFYSQPPYLVLRNLDPTKLSLSQEVVTHG